MGLSEGTSLKDFLACKWKRAAPLFSQGPCSLSLPGGHSGPTTGFLRGHQLREHIPRNGQEVGGPLPIPVDGCGVKAEAYG